MESELLVVMLLRAGFAVAAAVLLVLALRFSVRRHFGPPVAYCLWAIVPFAAAASLMPSYAEFRTAWIPRVAGVAPPIQLTTVDHVSRLVAHFAPVLIGSWGLGVLALTALIAVAEVRFRRRARLRLVGPAIVRVASPRLVVPWDFETRFTSAERLLIRRHERAHVDCGHPAANALVALLQVIFWFNPLVHVAAAVMRVDQELACDAAVLEFRPSERRAYAEVLLKAHTSDRAGPLACALTGRQGRGLENRIRLLMKGNVGVPEHVRGSVAVGALGVALAIGLWASGPDEMLRSQSLAFGGETGHHILRGVQAIRSPKGPINIVYVGRAK